jgi:hypothetical protein
MLQGEKSNSIEVYNKYFSEFKLVLKKKNSILFNNSKGNLPRKYICIKCWELNRNAYLAEEQNCEKIFSFFSSCKSLHPAFHSTESSYFPSFGPEKSLTLLILICLSRM